MELGSGVVNTTVSGTASAGKCNIPPLQLIVLDDPTNSASATVSLCNNSNALVAGCTGYQGLFDSGQATVATTSLAQTTYFPTAAALKSATASG